MSAPAFALIVGLLYSGLGLFAMLPSLVMPEADAAPAYGTLFGLFAVSGWLNAVHILVGFWGLVAWSGALGAVGYARAMSVLLGLLAILGVVPGVSDSLRVLPLDGHNVWLHGASALAAAYVGFRSMARRQTLYASVAERRHAELTDRRRAIRPTAYERRRGLADRRFGGGMTLPAG
jgi:hypothetical protein